MNEKPGRAPVRTHRVGAWSRQIAAELGCVLIDALGLAATLEWHLYQFQKCTGIPYDLAIDDTAGFEVPEEYAAGLFEMFHAALNDVARRPQPGRVRVALTISPHAVTMLMRDNGFGFSGGVAAVRSRARAYRGICEVAGSLAEGTTVTVSLPLPTRS